MENATKMAVKLMFHCQRRIQLLLGHGKTKKIVKRFGLYFYEASQNMLENITKMPVTLVFNCSYLIKLFLGLVQKLTWAVAGGRQSPDP